MKRTREHMENGSNTEENPPANSPVESEDGSGDHSNHSDSDYSDNDYSDNSDNTNSMDDFIVDDDIEEDSWFFDDEGNKKPINDETRKEAEEELKKVIDDIRKPKIILDPVPMYNHNWKNTNPSNPLPEDIKGAKAYVKWIIENKLGPNTTLEDYLKFLEKEEQNAVDNFIARKKRKLNDGTTDDKK